MLRCPSCSSFPSRIFVFPIGSNNSGSKLGSSDHAVNFLESLIALLAHTQKDIQEKTERVDKVGRSVGLKISLGKTKMMKMKNKSNVKTTVQGEDLEEVEHFKYLGSYVSSDSNIEKEVSTRIGMAAQAFNRLQNVWKSSILTTRTKLKIYRSNVRSVLLYASETWRTNKKIESRLRGFEGRCLRRILRIRWQDHIQQRRGERKK